MLPSAAEAKYTVLSSHPPLTPSQKEVHPLFLAVLALTAALQVAPGSIKGKVQDRESRTPLPGAILELPGLARFAVTDSTGSYLFQGVPPGSHRVTVRQVGFASRRIRAVVPSGGVIRIDISLRPDPIPVAGIDVLGLVPMKGGQKGDSVTFPDRRITMTEVRNHPLLAEPDVFQVLGGGEVYVAPEVPSGVHVRGGSSDQTGFLLDGIPVFNPYHVAGLFSAWNPDALSGLGLKSGAAPPPGPESLAGTVSATTRRPSQIFRAQGGIGTSNARLTADGPGPGHSGYLISARSGFPGGISAVGEASYLRGESSDWLGKVETPLSGGSLRVTGYEARNRIDASAEGRRGSEDLVDPPRNRFLWESRAVGGEWSRAGGSLTYRVRGWFSSSLASALWNASAETPSRLRSEREDAGIALEGELAHRTGATLLGLRLETSRTQYRTEEWGGTPSAFLLSARTPVGTGSIRHSRVLGPALRGEVGLSVPVAEGRARIAPSARITWEPRATVAVTLGYARLFQFAQSLRNTESVVGSIFPADLFLGSGATGIPVAGAHLGTLALELSPRPGVRLAAQGYRRASDGLILSAPVEGGPFSNGGFVVGSGEATGISLEGGLRAPRYGLVLEYGWQRVRLQHPGGRFTPQWGAGHTLESGVILFPTTTSSVRFGITTILNRRTTAVNGVLEWESCNLMDWGCEFGGSPDLGQNPRGGTRVPSYVRWDMGFQKHWHLSVGSRDVLVSLHATVTNLFSRKNLLTYAFDPETGERTGVEMRPRSPLVVGLDWRF